MDGSHDARLTNCLSNKPDMFNQYATGLLSSQSNEALWFIPIMQYFGKVSSILSTKGLPDEGCPLVAWWQNAPPRSQNLPQDPGGGTAIGWSTRMLGRIGYAFWQFMCQKGYGFQICVPERVGFWSAKCVPVFLVFVPVRVRVSRCRPSRGIHFPGEHPPPGTRHLLCIARPTLPVCQSFQNPYSTCWQSMCLRKK